MDPRPTKPDARPAAALDATKPARTSAYEPTVVRARQQPDEPLTDADKFLSPPQETGEVGRLGPYRVLGVLGRGGMGAVYRAEDPRLNRQVAVKVLLPDLAADEHAKARFRREAQAQARVEHDHIIPIYEVEEANGVVYLAMPLLKGLTLSAALKLNRRPPVAELVRIGREIAEGLAAAHEVGLIHRDIKPANVWLEGNKRRVKILDFGLAREAGAPVEVGAVRGPNAGRADDLTRPGALMGTPAYMSPEQARGQPLDLRSDVFSLGVVLYEMATGRKPFSGASQFDLLAAVATQEPYRAGQIVPDLPPALDALIHRMLAKDPAARPQNCDEVATELEAISRALVLPPVVVMPLHSQAEVQNEPNVWEDLDSTYASAPEPAADATAHEDEPAERDTEGEAAAPPRRVPKWALLATGAALVVLLVAFALSGRKPNDEVAKGDPPVIKGEKKEAKGETKGGKVNPPPPVPPDHRAAAKWVLENFGTVIVKPAGAPLFTVTALDKLPVGPFTVEGVALGNASATFEDPAPLAALTKLSALMIEGPKWTDDRLARVFGALEGAAVTVVTVSGFPHPLAKTGPALGGLKVGTLNLHSVAAGPFRASDLKRCVPSHVLKLSGSLRDTDLEGISEWEVWPKAFDLHKCSQLTGAGLDHIHAAGRPDRALAVLDFDLSETGVTEAEAAAFEARFRKSVVKWDGAALPLLRTRRAAQVALDRGAVLHVYGTPPVPLARGADLKAANDFRALAFGTGSFAVAIDPAKGWVQAAKGTVERPFTGDELAELLPHLPCQEVHLYGQNLTDAGAARACRALPADGLVALSLTDCGAGDETLRVLAERPALRSLVLNSTKVTHAGLAHLAGRAPLTQLRLADTGLTDAAVPALSAFAGLHNLDLKGTKLTDAGIVKLRAALPYTIIRDQRGDTHQPARAPLGSALAAKTELFARRGTGGNGGSSVTNPEKWGDISVNVSLYSGKYRVTATAGNGWDTKEERTGDVTKPFDAAELISLFREAGFTSFNNWQFFGQNIDDTGGPALFALPGASKLKYVQLRNCDVGDATAAHLARLPDLIDVFLNNTQVGDAGVKALAEGNPLLRQLRLEGCKGVTNAAVPHLSKMQRLVELDLKGTMITGDGAKQLAAALPYTYIRFDDKNKTQKLERKRDPYKAEAATRLLEARGGALRNGTPAQLSVRAAKYTDPQSPANGWEVARTDGKVEVPFDDADLLALVGDLLACDKPVTSLAFLCLNAQTVTDAGFVALARFPAIRAAHHIELIEMPLGDESAKALAGFPLLTKVALNGTQIGDAGVKALAAEHYGTLIDLRLARTRVTDAAVPDLLKMKWLRVLDLHGTKVSPEAAAKLSAALPKCAIRHGNDEKLGPKVRATREEALKKLLDRKVEIAFVGNKPLTEPKLAVNGRGVSLVAESGTLRDNGHAGANWERVGEKTGAVTEPLTDDDLELIAALELPQIWTLNLRGQKVTDAGLVPLLRSTGARHLRTATISDCPGVGDETVCSLAELPDLREVFVQRLPITDAGALALVQSRRGLQRLWLTGCDKLTDDLEPHLAKLFALRELDLKGTSVSAAAFDRLCKALPHTRVRPAEGKTYTPPNELLREGAKPVFELLISRGATKPDGAALDPDAFFKDTSSMLRVASGPYFEPMGPMHRWERADAFGPVKEPFGDADLVRSICELWRVPGANGPIPISYLALHKQNLTDAGVAALVALPQLRAAHSIHITMCAIGDEAVKHIAGLPNLKNAYLNRTQVTNAGVKHLVPRAATLDNLRLAHTLVTDGAIDDLLKLTNLTNLDLGGTKVTPEGAKKLAAGLPKCFIRWGDDKEIAPKK